MIYLMCTKDKRWYLMCTKDKRWYLSVQKIRDDI